MYVRKVCVLQSYLVKIHPRVNDNNNNNAVERWTSPSDKIRVDISRRNARFSPVMRYNNAKSASFVWLVSAGKHSLRLLKCVGNTRVTIRNRFNVVKTRKLHTCSEDGEKKN